MKNPDAEPRCIFVVEEIIIQAEGFIPHTNVSTFIQGDKKSTEASIVYEPQQPSNQI